MAARRVISGDGDLMAGRGRDEDGGKERAGRQEANGASRLARWMITMGGGRMGWLKRSG